MMTSWFKHARQTHTPVKNQREEILNRERGITASYRLCTAVQIAVQLVLWVVFYAYDRSVQTTWQAAIMLLLPLMVLWALWRAGARALLTNAGKLLPLALLPCLMLDATLLVRTTAGMVEQLIPEYPQIIRPLIPSILTLLTVIMSRENGVAFGTSTLKWFLLILFALATVLVGSSAHPSRLWPLLGQGLDKTALTALGGVGGVWGVALIFLLPVRKKVSAREHELLEKHSLWWTLLPWVLCVIWALWFSLTNPWRSGDMLPIGEKLMGMARHSFSIGISEMTGIMWIVLQPVALAGCAMSGEKLFRAAVPRLPRSLAAALVLLPGVICNICWPNDVMGALSKVLPWRAALSLLVGACMAIVGAKTGKGAAA